MYSSSVRFEAISPSGEKLYVKIEKGLFYSLFGDYETGLDKTELSRYKRSLTGFKSEYIGKNVITHNLPSIIIVKFNNIIALYDF